MYTEAAVEGAEQKHHLQDAAAESDVDDDGTLLSR